jgi:hypothetical protein
MRYFPTFLLYSDCTYDVFLLLYVQSTLLNICSYCRLLLFSLSQGLDHYALLQHLFRDISLMQKYLYHLLHGVCLAKWQCNLHDFLCPNACGALVLRV